MLWVRIVNPRTDKATPPLLALVDTGSDVCCFPSDVAVELGHNLTTVKSVPVVVPFGRGTGKAFAHTTCIEILDADADGEPSDVVLYPIPKKRIHFVRGGSGFFLGVGDFLRDFVVNIDYPAGVFSITYQ